MATESSFKRSKLSPRKLCVICSCDHDDTEFSLDEFNIFIVDLNGDASEEYVKTRPIIRLQGLGDDCFFCGLGSDLYMFKESGKRPVYKFNLEGHESSSCLVLDETSVEDSVVSSMPYRKHSPRTIPTPDGKIIVLSNNIFFYYPVMFDEDEEDGDAKSHSQMFDPIANVWEDLPELCIRQYEYPGNFEMLDGSGFWKKMPQSEFSDISCGLETYGRFFSISACCFIDESTLLVRIMSKHFGVEGHLLTLNIRSLNQGWKFYDGWQFLRSYLLQRQRRLIDELLIVENRLALDTLGGTSNTHGDFLFPRGGFEFGGWSRDIVLTDYVEDRECSFAIIFSEPVLCDVHRPSSLVVYEFKYELKLGICTPKFSTLFKFRVSQSCDWLIITNSFMLSPPPFPFKRQ